MFPHTEEHQKYTFRFSAPSNTLCTWGLIHFSEHVDCMFNRVLNNTHTDAVWRSHLLPTLVGWRSSPSTRRGAKLIFHTLVITSVTSVWMRILGADITSSCLSGARGILTFLRASFHHHPPVPCPVPCGPMMHLCPDKPFSHWPSSWGSALKSCACVSCYCNKLKIDG